MGEASSWFSKMAGQPMRLENLESVLMRQLQDLYCAEGQLIEALPRMAAAASATDLKSAFETHLEETRYQRTRLEAAFRSLGLEPQAETCEAMKRLIADADGVARLEGDAELKDAALIAAAQRIEHYEIAGYGCACAFARQLHKEAVAAMLHDTLDEEVSADKILSHISESLVTPLSGNE